MNCIVCDAPIGRCCHWIKVDGGTQLWATADMLGDVCLWRDGQLWYVPEYTLVDETGEEWSEADLDKLVWVEGAVIIHEIMTHNEVRT